MSLTRPSGATSTPRRLTLATQRVDGPFMQVDRGPGRAFVAGLELPLRTGGRRDG